MDVPRPRAGARDSEASQSNDTRSRGVQSVEVAVRLLATLARAAGPLSLSELSARTDMSPAKVHRYMASFVETGMVDHRRSGSYSLGRLAGEIGMAAIIRVDVVNRAADRLPDLVEQTNATGMLTVWGQNGPIVARWERSRVPLSTVLGVGSVLPLATTATGRAFAGHLPDRVVEPLLADQTRHDPVDLETLRSVDNDGVIYRADELFMPGAYSLASPVLDYDGVAAAVVTLISADRQLIKPGGLPERALREFL